MNTLLCQQLFYEILFSPLQKNEEQISPHPSSHLTNFLKNSISFGYSCPLLQFGNLEFGEGRCKLRSPTMSAIQRPQQTTTYYQVTANQLSLSRINGHGLHNDCTEGKFNLDSYARDTAANMHPIAESHQKLSLHFTENWIHKRWQDGTEMQRSYDGTEPNEEESKPKKLCKCVHEQTEEATACLIQHSRSSLLCAIN